MIARSFVATVDIKAAVLGHETEILDALGIHWKAKAHIDCPYPEHGGKRDWRWDTKEAKAFCTCCQKGDSIFNVVEKCEGLPDFEAAKIRVAEMMGRGDLVKGKGAAKAQRSAAERYLNPPANLRTDDLPRRYLAHRMAVDHGDIVMPSTPVAGWAGLDYYDPPPHGEDKPVKVGTFPAAVFGMVDSAGKTHAHRIYVKAEGLGKADLGTTPDGFERDPKKLARSTAGESIAGRSVIWGNPTKAQLLMLAEGIETAAAIAFAFRKVVLDGQVAVAAAITAGGVEAFKPYPSTKRVTVCADRDEKPRPSKVAPTRRGEQAARAFGTANRSSNTWIAMPGVPGSKRDWLDILVDEGEEAVRAGILAAEPFTATPEEIAADERRKTAASAVNDNHHMNGAALAKPGQERALMAVNGLMMPTARDRLRIAPDLEQAPEFPVDVLPPIARAAVEALVEHVQAPAGLCAHSVLGAIALVAQGLANVQVPNLPTPRPLSLYLLAIAESGERKTACDSLALRAVSRFEAELHSAYEESVRIYKADHAAYSAEVKKIQNDREMGMEERKRKLRSLREPDEPLAPIIRTREPTFEGLCNLLLKGRASMGVFTSEGGTFLGGHGLTEDAKIRTMTGLSEFWDNGSSQRVRAKEISIIVDRRVSISLAAQERIVAPLLGDAVAVDQGFLARFLITMPASTIGTREIRVSRPHDDPKLISFHERLTTLLDADLPLKSGTRNELQLPSIEFDEDAWQVWQQIAQDIENQCGPGGDWHPVKPAALKMGENIARIAGALAVFERGAPTSDNSNMVTGEDMAAAATIGGFYLQEALRLSGNKLMDPETRASDALAGWLTTVWPGDLISPSVIQQKAPRHLRSDAETTRGRILKLVAAGVIAAAGPGTIDGKPYRETYRVNRDGAPT